MMENIQPIQTSNHSSNKVFVQKDSQTCTHVFLRDDTVRPPLKAPYDGPFEVLSRTNKTFELRVKNRIVRVNVDRIKAAYQPIEEEEPKMIRNQPNTTQNPTSRMSVETKNYQPGDNSTMTTKSGRIVRNMVA